MRVFVNAQGQPAKTIRLDGDGNAILETREQEGQTLVIQRTFDQMRTLVRERHLLNGAVIEDREFR